MHKSSNTNPICVALPDLSHKYLKASKFNPHNFWILGASLHSRLRCFNVRTVYATAKIYVPWISEFHVYAVILPDNFVVRN